jgi:hypothetical protein
MPNKNKKSPESSHTYSHDDTESSAAARGAPVRGFEEDDEYTEYKREGMTFIKTPDASARAGLVDRRGEVYPGDPDIGSGAKQDLRYGGEDVSGVSEWSMRARNLELDDGLDAGDFIRPDTEILDDIFDACEEQGLQRTGVDFEVAGAEVTIRGRADKQTGERLEQMLLDIPGVKLVKNLLEQQR